MRREKLALKHSINILFAMYFCFNIVTGDHNYPAAVLIRAVELMAGSRERRSAFPTKNKLINGPGKFCRAFEIDKSLNGADITKSKVLWLEGRGVKIKKVDIAAAKRIGVDYAKEYKDKLWRFYIKSNLISKLK